jgi:hypothetical protein
VLRCSFTEPAIRRMCEISTMVNGSLADKITAVEQLANGSFLS